MPSRSAARRGAGVLAALMRRGTLGTDPEVLGVLADLIHYVTEESDMDTRDEIVRLDEYIARLRSELAQAERLRAHLEADAAEADRVVLDAGVVGVVLPFGAEKREAA